MIKKMMQYSNDDTISLAYTREMIGDVNRNDISTLKNLMSSVTKLERLNVPEEPSWQQR